MKDVKGQSPLLQTCLLAEETTKRLARFVRLIEASREKALQAVNTALTNLYWQVGETISRKIEAAEWGDGVVDELAAYIARTQPGLRGFTRANLFRMRQFYQTYCAEEKVAPLARQCPGNTISSFWAKVDARKSASFTFAWRFRSGGVGASWSARSRRHFSSVPY